MGSHPRKKGSKKTQTGKESGSRRFAIGNFGQKNRGKKLIQMKNWKK